MSTNISPDCIREVISKAKLVSLVLPIPPRIDHADHIIKTALDGHTKLAADHVLHPEMRGQLTETISSLIRRLGLLFEEELSFKENLEKNELEDIIIKRYRIYDALLELLWNLIGVEKKWAHLPDEEVAKSMEAITYALDEWEKQEKEKLGSSIILRYTIDSQLNKMELVNKGNSMVAWIAKEIKKELKDDKLTESYTQALRKVIEKNFYYIAYKEGLCKFGNDYALGLRWLRHLGYVQVSTNPLLAAIAYDDDPSLWESFKEYAKRSLMNEYPEWFKEPEKYADAITMEATRFALLDNFYVFRVPFVLSKYHDGLVSYQLNPLIADNVEKSVAAAREFAQRLESTLAVYDSYLFWGYEMPYEKGRPNLVIKVAAAYPASIEVTRRLNEIGIGQNITLSYTVSQEVIIGVAALEGMAGAIKKGIIPTQTYDTNMGGRLEDHLRESVAASFLLKAIEPLDPEKREKILDNLASKLNLKGENLLELKKKSIREKIEFLTSKKILGGNLLNPAYVEVLMETGTYRDKENLIRTLSSFDDALKLSGTFIAQRVYEILFSPWNKQKWLEYLVKNFGISKSDAEFITDRLDLLPASKRKPIDTLFTLSRRNITNTEFPNHQLDVVREATKEEFRIEDYAESIIQKLDENKLNILLSLEDFVKAYEASPELNQLLEKAGIKRNYGTRGVQIKEWPNYGPCAKTLDEFTKAYLTFRLKVLNTIKELK
ncbi:MAG: transaldolase family protein [Thermoproteota archaeon]